MEQLDRSYRNLFAIPDLRRVVVSMQLARVAQSMVAVALVLFTLAKFDSPLLAGVVTFASTFPGALLSPIAGALLDRHGRVRLIRVDYLVALITMLLIGGLSLADLLSAPLLVAIAAVASITMPLSLTGLRGLFPLMVPEPLWERINAVDSNGFWVASIVGPALAAALVGFLGPEAGVIAIAVPYALAILALVGVAEPATTIASTGRLLRDALDGVHYVWRNSTLRGLLLSIPFLNMANGVIAIVIPVIVLDRLRAPEYMVGFLFALSGVAGVASVFAFGRIDSRGREWRLLVNALVLVGPALAILFFAISAPALAAPALGLAVAGLSMFIRGLLNGPIDIGLFTIRQRRTDPAWLGRAFSISIAFNYAGFPVGAAVAGALAAQSLDLAICAAVVAAAVAALSASQLVPRFQPTRA